jgi:hypothetical protein
VTRTLRRWLPSVILGTTTLAVIVGGPVGVAHAASAPPPTAAGVAPGIPAPGATAAMTHHETRLQPNYYYCAPAATRIALSTHGEAVSFDQLAAELGTTTAGTRSAYEVTRVMNAHVGTGRYKTVEISGERATPEQVAVLRNDILLAVNRGDAVIANVIGTVTDSNGEVHSYPGGHFLTVVGYADRAGMVRIADPADAVGSPEYDLTVTALAHWIGTRGYTA